MGTGRVATGTALGFVAPDEVADIEDVVGLLVCEAKLAILPTNNGLHHHIAGDDEEIEQRVDEVLSFTCKINLYQEQNMSACFQTMPNVVD